MAVRVSPFAALGLEYVSPLSYSVPPILHPENGKRPVTGWITPAAWFPLLVYTLKSTM